MSQARWAAGLFLVLALASPALAEGELFIAEQPPPPVQGLCLAQPRHPACGRVLPEFLPSWELLPYFAGKHPWISSRPLRLGLEIGLMCALACLLDSPLAAGLLLAALIAAWLARGWLPHSFRSSAAFQFLSQPEPPRNLLWDQLKEHYYLLFVALAAALLVWRSKNPTPGRSFLSALGLGASLLFRSALFFLPPVLAAFDVILLRRVLPAKRRRASILILALVPYLMLIPWIRMNLAVRHRFMPVEAGAGGADNNIVTGALGIVYTIEPSPMYADLAPSLPKASGSLRVLAWAAGEVLRHPLRYLIACARRLGFVFSLWPLLFSFAVLALWLYRKEREFQPMGILIGYFVGIFCLMSIERGYFIPLAPLLAATAAAGASRMLGRLSPKGLKVLGGRGAKRMGDSTSSAAVLGCLGWALLWSGYVVGKVEAYAWVYPTLPESRVMTDEELDSAIRRHPGDAWLLGLRGRRELRGQRWRSAVRDFSAALSAQPANQFWELYRAWARARLGRPKELLRGLWVRGDKCAYYFLSAVEYWREGKRSQADIELSEMSKGGRYGCFCNGFSSERGSALPEEDSKSEERLKEKCHDDVHYWIKAYAPIDNAVSPLEERALKAEYARVTRAKKSASLDPAPKGKKE